MVILKVFMGLILLVPSLRENILQPAINVLMSGQGYAETIKKMAQLP